MRQSSHCLSPDFLQQQEGMGDSCGHCCYYGDQREDEGDVMNSLVQFLLFKLWSQITHLETGDG